MITPTQRRYVSPTREVLRYTLRLLLLLLARTAMRVIVLYGIGVAIL